MIKISKSHAYLAAKWSKMHWRAFANSAICSTSIGSIYNNPNAIPVIKNIEREVVEPMPDDDTLVKARVSPEVLNLWLEPALYEHDRFKFNEMVTIENLFDARAHLGHKIGTVNENMKWALYGERFGVCIFDLEITRKYLVRALDFVANVAYCGGKFLFVTTNKAIIQKVEETAAELGDFSNCRKWKKGTFLNTECVFGAPVRHPDCLIFLNTQTTARKLQHPAIHECAKMCIPTVAIVDSNCDPSTINYVIPGNDDSLTSLGFYTDLFEQAISEGREAAEEQTPEKQQRRYVPIQPPQFTSQRERNTFSPSSDNPWSRNNPGRSPYN